MARAGKQFLALDTSYPDDARVAELSALAVLADVLLMLLSKRLGTDGRLTVTQARKEIAYRIGGDVAPIIGELSTADLWLEEDGGLTRRSWSKWNTSAADIETMSKGGSKGNHLRWHVKRNVVDPNCPLCASGGIGTDVGANRVPDETRIADIDVDTDRDVDRDELDLTCLTSSTRSRARRSPSVDKGPTSIGADLRAMGFGQ